MRQRLVDTWLHQQRILEIQSGQSTFHSFQPSFSLMDPRWNLTPTCDTLMRSASKTGSSSSWLWNICDLPGIGTTGIRSSTPTGAPIATWYGVLGIAWEEHNIWWARYTEVLFFELRKWVWERWFWLDLNLVILCFYVQFLAWLKSLRTAEDKFHILSGVIYFLHAIFCGDLKPGYFVWWMYNVGQRMRKVPQQYPEFFGQGPSNCQKQYFLLTLTLFLGISCWHYWHFLIFLADITDIFWVEKSNPQVFGKAIRSLESMTLFLIEGWDCSIFRYHIWYLVSSMMFVFCSLYMFVLPILVDKLINNATSSLSHTSTVWLITTILVSYTSSWSVNIDWLPPVWHAILYSFLVDSNRSTQQSKLENHPTLAC